MGGDLGELTGTGWVSGMLARHFTMSKDAAGTLWLGQNTKEKAHFELESISGTEAGHGKRRCLCKWKGSRGLERNGGDGFKRVSTFVNSGHSKGCCVDVLQKLLAARYSPIKRNLDGLQVKLYSEGFPWKSEHRASLASDFAFLVGLLRFCRT